MIEDALLKPKEAARMLGVHVDTLRHWRNAGKGFTKSICMNNQHRYRRSELLRYLEEQTRDSAVLNKD